MIRGSDSKVYYKKAVLKGSKDFTDKNQCMSLFLNASPYGLELFLEKGFFKGVFL